MTHVATRVPCLPHSGTEIVVRALGLNPVVDTEEIHGYKEFSKAKSRLVGLGIVSALIVVSGGLVWTELYSKRSSLGCPVPTFILCWFVVALLPAAFEVLVMRWQRRHRLRRAHAIPLDDLLSTSLTDREGRPATSARRSGNAVTQETDRSGNAVHQFSMTISDSIPGGDSHWVVQFVWAIYYTAGTLVFTSIMLVTVTELVVWVLASFAMTAVEKMAAYKLCGYWGTGFKGRRTS